MPNPEYLDKELRLKALSWENLSEDGLGVVAVTLEVDRESFKIIQELFEGIHKVWSSGRDYNKLELSNPVLLRVVEK